MPSSQAQILDALLYFRSSPAISVRWNFEFAENTSVNAPGGIGSGFALTYSFPTTLPPYSENITGFQALTPEQKDAARAVLAHYASVSGLTFVETSQLGASNIALIQHDFASSSLTGAAGYANSPGLTYSFNPATGIIASVYEVPPGSPEPLDWSSGDVFIRSGYATGDYALGGAGYELMLHELGHSIGLKHPFEEGPTLPVDEDHKGFTVMAYNEAPQSLSIPVTGTEFGGYSFTYDYIEPRSLMLYDILAIQHTYGANQSHESGDNTYSWATSEKFLETLWDGGGIDTISAAGQTLGSVINLAPGSFSSIGWRQTQDALLADIPAFARAEVVNNLLANGLSVMDLYSGLNNLAIAFGVDIENATGGSGADLIMGNALGNLLLGAEGDDTIQGGSGADTLNGGAGNDELDGGDGEDTVSYADAGEGVSVDLARAGPQFISTSRGSDQLVSIENITGSAHNDVLFGTAGANVLNGGGGADSLYGGAGDDTYHVDTQSDLVFEHLDGGTDAILSTVSFYLYAHVERLTLTDGTGNLFGSGNDRDNTLTGNEGNNLLLGWDGNDTLLGNAGNDNLYGVEGADSLLGGAGIDNLIGGNGNDTLDGGSDPDALYGEDGNDVLFGGTGFFTDILIGGAGDDTLDGSASVASGLPRNQGDYDRMNGGAGNDTYYVDTPSDLTFEALNDGTDTVIADINGAGYYLYANVENLTLIGNTPFGVGNELANTLTGSALANWLLGGAGNDTINGGGGNDVLFGEGGADTFVFRRGTGGDLIGDFTPGTDKIDIAGIGYGSFAQVQARMVQNGGSTAIDLGLGDFVVLVGVVQASLGSADFLLV
jgi:Ca2+-binding RTX toxin-like protein